MGAERCCKVTWVPAYRTQPWMTFSLRFHRKPHELPELQMEAGTNIMYIRRVPAVVPRPLSFSTARVRMDLWLTQYSSSSASAVWGQCGFEEPTERDSKLSPASVIVVCTRLAQQLWDTPKAQDLQ